MVLLKGGEEIEERRGVVVLLGRVEVEKEEKGAAEYRATVVEAAVTKFYELWAIWSIEMDLIASMASFWSRWPEV